MEINACAVRGFPPPTVRCRATAFILLAVADLRASCTGRAGECQPNGLCRRESGAR